MFGQKSIKVNQKSEFWGERSSVVMVQELGLLDGGRVLGQKSYDFWAEIVKIMAWIVILAGKMLIINNDFSMV